MSSVQGSSGPGTGIDGRPNAWLDLQTVVDTVRRRWLLVALVTAGVTSAAIGASLLMSDWYRSAVVAVMATRAPGGLGGALGQLGSLASLAGISLPGSESDQREEAIQYLRSDTLARRFIEKNGLVQRIYASKWDATGSRWLVADAADAPTLNDAVEYFKRRMVSVSYDRRTGVVSVAMLWKHPAETAELANEFVELANEDLRRRALEESERKLEYLKRLTDEVTEVAQRQLIFELMQSEISFGMLANARPDYAFRVVDVAAAPDADRPALPRRGVIAVSGLFAGLVLGIGLALLADFVGRRRVVGRRL